MIQLVLLFVSKSDQEGMPLGKLSNGAGRQPPSCLSPISGTVLERYTASIRGGFIWLSWLTAVKSSLNLSQHFKNFSYENGSVATS